MRVRGFWCALAVAGVALWSGCSSRPAEPPPLTYNMGEKVRTGAVTYTVFETQWMTQFGTGVTARVPQNRFFLVRMTAVNGGSSDAIIPNFTIEDDQGKTYEELSNGDGAPQWVGYLRSAKPADFVSGNIVFDAPPAHYKLHLADDAAGTHKAIVDIPLSFGAETPEVVTPGELGLPKKR